MAKKCKKEKKIGKSSGSTQQNPFELHHDKVKSNVIGRKVNIAGKPGMSRARAIRKRDETLLQEYTMRHKTNIFADRRIGEKRSNIDPEQRKYLRMAMRAKNHLHQKNQFSLSDEVELTHGGVALGTGLTSDSAQFSDEDDYDNLSDSFVDQHFGGGSFLTKRKDIADDRPKSHKEWMEFMIAKSKLSKDQSRKDRDDHQIAVAKLDSEYKNVMEKLSFFQKKDESKRKVDKASDFSDFDFMVRELKFDRSNRAEAKGSLKTDEELAAEAKRTLDLLEKDKERRMVNDKDDEELKVTHREISIDALEPYILKSAEVTQQKQACLHNPKNTNKFDGDLEDLLEVPDDYDEFWIQLSGKTPDEVRTLISKFVSGSHPSLKEGNKKKCQLLFAFLLQTLHVLCDAGGEDSFSSDFSPFEYIDIIIPSLYKLAKVSPDASASSFIKVLEEKHEDYIKGVSFPYADTFVFLKLAPLLFPASDFRHCVMTPVLVFLMQILGECRPTDRRDVVSGLFTCHLLHECTNYSKKFVPELVPFLCGLLYLAIPGTDKLHLPVFPPFKRLEKKPGLLALEERVNILNRTPLSLASLNMDEDITVDFKVTVMDVVAELLSKLAQTWRDLPSLQAILSPAVALLSSLPIDHYPLEVSCKLTLLKAHLQKLESKNTYLVRKEGKPKPLKMYEPILEEEISARVGLRTSRRPVSEKQRLIRQIKRERKGAKREILRDTAYLAREKLKETLESDAERKRRVKLILGSLSLQEGECKGSRKKKRFT